MNGTRTETLTRLAQSMESLRPVGAQPAWAEIIGPLEEPERTRWHPDLTTMVGFLAPPTCNAITAVGYGWAHGMEEGPPAAVQILAPGERRRVRVVCLMSRQGETAGYLRDGTKILIDEPPSIGRVLDSLRRCFRLPTPPPTEATDRLLADIWLNNVLGAAMIAAHPLPWLEVTKRHPIIECAAGGGIEIPAAQFRRIVEVGTEVWDWTYLAHQIDRDGWLDGLLPEGAGGWMDEGILSRWVLDSLPPLEVRLDQVTPLIHPDAAKKLRSALGQWGLVHPPPRRASTR